MKFVLKLTAQNKIIIDDNTVLRNENKALRNDITALRSRIFQLEYQVLDLEKNIEIVNEKVLYYKKKNSQLVDEIQTCQEKSKSI